jgi:ABC-type tungstate transport system permease subunit
MVATRRNAKQERGSLVSPEGQQAIGAYQVNGERLFNPSAGAPK